MTFYEAAIHILERTGKPMTTQAITEVALKENLLSHVGKEPDVTMHSRLMAMARRKGDRRIMMVAPETFALIEWGEKEDAAATAEPVEPSRPEAGQPPLRGRERHPEPDTSNVRVLGRGERPRRKRRPEREERRRRLPPLPEVAFEILSQAGQALRPVDIAAAARERGMVTEDLGAETLVSAMEAENRRRVEAGRQPVFAIGPDGEVSLRAAVPGEAPPTELQAAVATALGVPLRPAAPKGAAKAASCGPGATRVIAQAQEHRRQILRLVRRRLGDLEASAFAEASLQLLREADFRDLRTMKREMNAASFVGRRREGAVDVRYAIQALAGSREVKGDDVQELRREVGRRSAQVGVLVASGEVTREARHEASLSGAPLVALWCGEALAEKYMEHRLGSAMVKVEVWDLDEDFFRVSRDRGRQAPWPEAEAPGRTEGPAAVPIPLTEVVAEGTAAGAALGPTTVGLRGDGPSGSGPPAVPADTALSGPTEVGPSGDPAASTEAPVHTAQAAAAKPGAGASTQDAPPANPSGSGVSDAGTGNTG